MIDVLWLNYNPEAPPYGYWCYGWLEDFFQLKGAQEWRHHQFRHHTEVSSLGENTGAIVIIPAEYNAEHVGQSTRCWQVSRGLSSSWHRMRLGYSRSKISCLSTRCGS